VARDRAVASSQTSAIFMRFGLLAAGDFRNVRSHSDSPERE
jgi:hypothetical protein